MPKLSNQEIERHYFEMFRTHYPLPDGAVEYGDKPDVIVRGERSLGIEITNFFRAEGSLPESEQVQRLAREAVVAKADALYRPRNPGKSEFFFGFDADVPIRDQNKLSKQIADFVGRGSPQISGQVSREQFQDIPELSFVYFNAGEYEDARWRIIQTYGGSFMSVERLKEIVNAKEAKSKDYRPCDAYWLLVVVDFIDRAQDQEIRIEGYETILSPVFEKILVYKTYFGHVVETNQSGVLTRRS